MTSGPGQQRRSLAAGIVEQSCDGCCRVHFLVPMVSDPHFEPSPRQIRGILQAVLWFIIGELFEAKALSESHPSVQVPSLPSNPRFAQRKRSIQPSRPLALEAAAVLIMAHAAHPIGRYPPPKVAEFQQSISTDQVDFGSPAAVYIRSSGRFDTATHRNLPSGSQKAA